MGGNSQGTKCLMTATRMITGAMISAKEQKAIKEERDYTPQ